MWSTCSLPSDILSPFHYLSETIKVSPSARSMHELQLTWYRTLLKLSHINMYSCQLDMMGWFSRFSLQGHNTRALQIHFLVSNSLSCTCTQHPSLTSPCPVPRTKEISFSPQRSSLWPTPENWDLSRMDLPLGLVHMSALSSGFLIVSIMLPRRANIDS